MHGIELAIGPDFFDLNTNDSKLEGVFVGQVSSQSVQRQFSCHLPIKPCIHGRIEALDRQHSHINHIFGFGNGQNHLGLAKTVGESAPESAISVLGGFAGTPEFASPEQFAGVGVDIRSDLYSLGVTVWKMLTGRIPFSGSPPEVMYQHQHATLPLEQVKDVPQPFVDLLEALLEKDPGKRPQSPVELQAQLRQLSVELRTKDQWTRKSLPGVGAERKRPRWHDGKAWIASGAIVLTAALLC